MGPGQRLRAVQCLGELVVLAVVGSALAGPHLLDDLECLLQSLETLGHLWKGDAQPERLTLVPGRADTQVGAAVGEHIQGRYSFSQYSRVAVDHTGDHRTQLDVFREARQVGKNTVAF